MQAQYGSACGWLNDAMRAKKAKGYSMKSISLRNRIISIIYSYSNAQRQACRSICFIRLVLRAVDAFLQLLMRMVISDICAN
mmetsp:Transcript_35184/g.48994  ORF Transcript_35184/g.48994 Transcript_35184/m.48994 type:complete len:82 (-) Transcript_35184:33-278(-)